MQMTKFPGGGLEFGEGVEDCVIREFKEELNLDVEIDSHFYTTGHYQQSAFNPDHQLVSIYYKVRAANSMVHILQEGKMDILETGDQFFYWVSLTELTDVNLTFPIDQLVGRMLTGGY